MMAKPTSVADSSPAVEATEAPAERPMPATGALRWADERLGLASLLKKNLRKVFPDHWSFLLGEIALYVISQRIDGLRAYQVLVDQSAYTVAL